MRRPNTRKVELHPHHKRHVSFEAAVPERGKVQEPYTGVQGRVRPGRGGKTAARPRRTAARVGARQCGDGREREDYPIGHFFGHDSEW